MTERSILPNRRGNEFYNFMIDGIAYTACIGRCPDGRIGEVFLDAGKIGSGVETAARDAAVAASLALQHGCSVETLRHALTASGPIARALDLAEAAR